jgi:hypothetical protein
MALIETELRLRGGKGRSLPVPSVGSVIEPLESRVLLSVSLALSGTQTILAGTNQNVSMDSDRHQSEMQIAINPANPLNLIAIFRGLGFVLALTRAAKTGKRHNNAFGGFAGRTCTSSRAGPSLPF